ncbi:MAG: glutamate synthase large subunit [Lachnospiraceae bacterium]|nr:glutamate synthase large subunit [Lachnospiraceae bacterium]
MNRQEQQGLYREEFEHDNCGIGLVVDMKGRPSHDTVDSTLKIVENLEHRAGKDADGKTGDGVGILLQISHRFFSKAMAAQGVDLGGPREYGIAMFYFPQKELARKQAQKMFEIVVRQEGMEFLGWREVPTSPEILGQRALDSMPGIWQGFVKKPADVACGIDFDRKLYVARRVFEQSNDNTYVVSMSSRTIVYKGMFLVGQLRDFYLDLQDEEYESAIGITHSRFSTNTNPSWERSHPYRMLVHNGEINTINGNVDKMTLREEKMESPVMPEQLHKVLPVVDPSGSDSARLDNVIEFLVMNGMDLPLAVMITIPEAWLNDKTMSLARRNFYKYYATMMEPWDGPASIIFTDGDLAGAVLDRNGFRPSRYYITDDDKLILTSEVGALEDLDEAHVVRKDRLRPGKMLLVDTVKGVLVDDDQLKNRYANRQPFGEWLDNHLVPLKKLKVPNERYPHYDAETRARLQKAFGYSHEDFRTSILTMAETGSEPIAAMGADNPLPVLSKRRQPLFTYFKQQFAQVTNPPLDALREEIVTSTRVYLGSTGNLLEEKAENCNVLSIDDPILTDTDMMKIRAMKVPGLQVDTVSILHYKGTKLDKALKNLFSEVDYCYKNGTNILILSDRGVDENHVPIPSLLAVSAVRQHLVRSKNGSNMSLILESGEPREVHHFATLMGFGAVAIYPYLAHETIYQLVKEDILKKDYHTAVDDYNYAVLHGITKITSKMGISTLQSYEGAKVFEAMGIDADVVEQYFTGTTSRIGGISLKDMDRQTDQLHSTAFDPLGLPVDLTLNSTGGHKMRSGKEDHLYNPLTIHLLQQACWTGSYDLFKQYEAAVIGEDRETNLRSLIDIVYPEGGGIPIEEVQSVEEIVKHFRTGAMSYGSLSPEAHETLAVAMNHLGGRSNTGEGGQPEERSAPNADGIWRGHAIKQVASGRFGVTSHYLVDAKELQIKIAQGAKPGEGGHLPGAKVYPWVAETRNSTPGVGLISPPPHHDIYSIEDLAQLIYDLKNANNQADISVKLVSEAGVGTIAAGVAKAGAEVILISGAVGGTGAAPRSSIYNAGLPWEVGLAETHQTLIQNGLRNKVRLETDGKLMTGRDVAIACMMGAEGFGFGTGPLVSMGCVMMRVCNLDTCPVGVTTQNPELRKNFKGKPEYVENFMKFMAQDLREIMAKLGMHSIEELCGRSEFLKTKSNIGKENPRANTLRLAALCYDDAPRDQLHFKEGNSYDFQLNKTLDARVLIPKFTESLKTGAKKEISVKVGNTDRTFGTMLGSEVTRKFGNTLEDDTMVIHARGHGGQSFGAFLPKGITLELEGDSNDHLGKGLSGGRIIVFPDRTSKLSAEDNIIIGNVALYGATGGKVFVNGVAGERFCVRNSGATAVVEGVGNHGCEYMTGGVAVILGEAGKNFAAGMSGGVAYVLDMSNDLYLNLNRELVYLETVTESEDIQLLKQLIREHVEATGSKKGQRILDDFMNYVSRFRKIIPKEYKEMLELTDRIMGHGVDEEAARIQAFYSRRKEKRA